MLYVFRSVNMCDVRLGGSMTDLSSGPVSSLSGSEQNTDCSSSHTEVTEFEFLTF